MAKKKKDQDEELPLYLWLRSYTKRLVPPKPFFTIPKQSKSSFTWATNQLQTPSWKKGTTISSMGPGLSVSQQVSFYLQQNSLRDGAFPAYLYYGKAGLADPKGPIEAYGYGGFLGYSGLTRAVVGAATAGVIGFAVAGAIGVTVDPMHQWSGGWDETADYQETMQMYRESNLGPWHPGQARLD